LIEGERMVRVGRVGRPHGTHGAFRVADPTERLELLDAGRELTVPGVGPTRVAERRGTPERPILRLEGLAAADIRGSDLLVPRGALGELPEGEWLADDLVGLRVEGVGAVTGVRLGPSVDVLEVEDEGGGEVLVPLNRDAIRSIDVAAGRIEVDRRFLGLE
jgi:16S rRNA processing protein RimM